MRTTGWPTTTRRARARVVATLNLLGFRQNPRWGSEAVLEFCASAMRLNTGGRDSARDKTVEMKTM